MFSDNGNLLKPDVVCSAKINKKYDYYYSMMMYEILFDTRIETDGIRLHFNNPEIHYKDYDILVTGTSYHSNEMNTGYTLLISENSKFLDGQQLVARIKKTGKKIDIFLEDVQ